VAALWYAGPELDVGLALQLAGQSVWVQPTSAQLLQHADWGQVESGLKVCQGKLTPFSSEAANVRLMVYLARDAPVQRSYPGRIPIRQSRAKSLPLRPQLYRKTRRPGCRLGSGTASVHTPAYLFSAWKTSCFIDAVAGLAIHRKPGLRRTRRCGEEDYSPSVEK
jgi:hypothetical protein